MLLQCCGCVQVTDESHVDKPYLVVAMTAMTEVAAAINEFKRRKDLGTYCVSFDFLGLRFFYYR